MAVTGTRVADFVIYTRKGLSVQRIPFDHDLWTKDMLPKLKSFYTHYIVAELHTQRVKRDLKLYTSTDKVFINFCKGYYRANENIKYL